MIVVGVVALVGLAVAAVLATEAGQSWYRSLTGGDQSSDSDTGGSAVEDEDNAALNQSLADGENNQVDAYLRDIERTDDVSKKADLLNQLATALALQESPSEQQIADALDYARQAYEYDSSAASAATIATVARIQGDDELAAEYQQIVRDKNAEDDRVYK